MKRKLMHPRPKWHPYITKKDREELKEINNRLEALRRVGGSLVRRRAAIMAKYENQKKFLTGPPKALPTQHVLF